MILAILNASKHPTDNLTTGTSPCKIHLYTRSELTPPPWSLDPVNLTQAIMYNCYTQRPCRLAPRGTSHPSTSQSALLTHIILTLAGDIELNPVPPNYTADFPCAVCTQDVTWASDALQCDGCDGCDQWIHKDCMGMSTNQYNKLGQTSTIWICNTCGLLNLSTGLITSISVSTSNIFLDIEVSNIDNDTLPSISISLAGPPIFSSSPLSPIHNLTTTLRKMESITIINVNCQSSKAKKEPFHILISRVQPDIVLGIESWMRDGELDQVAFPTSSDKETMDI